MNMKKTLYLGISIVILILIMGLRVKSVSLETYSYVPIYMDSCTYEDGVYTIEYTNGTIYTQKVLNKDEVSYSTEGNIVEFVTAKYQKQLTLFGHKILNLNEYSVEEDPIFYVLNNLE